MKKLLDAPLKSLFSTKLCYIDFKLNIILEIFNKAKFSGFSLLTDQNTPNFQFLETLPPSHGMTSLIVVLLKKNTHCCMCYKNIRITQTYSRDKKGTYP